MSLFWARKAFRELRGVRPELEAIDAQHDRRDRDARALQRRLLWIRAEDSTAAALRALASAPPTDAVRALREQIQIERLRVAGMSRAPKARVRPVNQLAAVGRSLRGGWTRLLSLASMPLLWARRLSQPPRRSVTNTALVLTGAAGVILAAVIGAALWPAEARLPFGAAASRGQEGQVAGGNPLRTPNPGAPAPIRATFDQLVMGARLPPDWHVAGGNAGQVQVAPIPTAVNRSLRLTSGADGSATELCRVMDPAASLVAVDLLAAQPDGLAVSLRNPGSGLQTGIAVASFGSAVIQPSGEQMVGTIFLPSEWQRVTFFHDPVGGMRASISNPATAPTVNGSSELPGWQPGGQRAEICVSSPPVPDAELFIDNLVIE